MNVEPVVSTSGAARAAVGREKADASDLLKVHNALSVQRAVDDADANDGEQLALNERTAAVRQRIEAAQNAASQVSGAQRYAEIANRGRKQKLPANQRMPVGFDAQIDDIAAFYYAPGERGATDPQFDAYLDAIRRYATPPTAAVAADYNWFYGRRRASERKEIVASATAALAEIKNARNYWRTRNEAATTRAAAAPAAPPRVEGRGVKLQQIAAALAALHAAMDRAVTDYANAEAQVTADAYIALRRPTGRMTRQIRQTLPTPGRRAANAARETLERVRVNDAFFAKWRLGKWEDTRPRSMRGNNVRPKYVNPPPEYQIALDLGVDRSYAQTLWKLVRTDFKTAHVPMTWKYILERLLDAYADFRFSDDREGVQLVAYNPGEPAPGRTKTRGELTWARRARPLQPSRRAKAGFEPDNDLLLAQQTGNLTTHLKAVVADLKARRTQLLLQNAKREQDWNMQSELEAKSATLQTTRMEDTRLEELRVERARARAMAKADWERLATMPDAPAVARAAYESVAKDFTRRSNLLDGYIKFMEQKAIGDLDWKLRLIDVLWFRKADRRADEGERRRTNLVDISGEVNGPLFTDLVDEIFHEVLPMAVKDSYPGDTYLNGKLTPAELEWLEKALLSDNQAATARRMGLTQQEAGGQTNWERLIRRDVAERILERIVPRYARGEPSDSGMGDRFNQAFDDEPRDDGDADDYAADPDDEAEARAEADQMDQAIERENARAGVQNEAGKRGDPRRDGLTVRGDGDPNLMEGGQSKWKLRKEDFKFEPNKPTNPWPKVNRVNRSSMVDEVLNEHLTARQKAKAAAEGRYGKQQSAAERRQHKAEGLLKDEQDRRAREAAVKAASGARRAAALATKEARAKEARQLARRVGLTKARDHAQTQLDSARDANAGPNEIAELAAELAKRQGELDMLQGATPLLLPEDERQRRVESALAGPIDYSTIERDPEAVAASALRFEQLRSAMNDALRKRLEDAKANLDRARTMRANGEVAPDQQTHADAYIRERMAEVADIERMLGLRVETEAERRERYRRDFLNSVRNHVRRTRMSDVLAKAAIDRSSLTAEWFWAQLLPAGTTPESFVIASMYDSSGRTRKKTFKIFEEFFTQVGDAFPAGVGAAVVETMVESMVDRSLEFARRPVAVDPEETTTREAFLRMWPEYEAEFDYVKFVDSVRRMGLELEMLAEDDKVMFQNELARRLWREMVRAGVPSTVPGMPRYDLLSPEGREAKASAASWDPEGHAGETFGVPGIFANAKTRDFLAEIGLYDPTTSTAQLAVYATMVPGGTGNPMERLQRRFKAEDVFRAIWMRKQMEANSDWQQMLKDRFRVDPADDEDARRAEEEAGIKYWEENADDDELKRRIRRAKAEVTRKNNEGLIPDGEVEDRKVEAEEAVLEEYGQSLFDEGKRLFKETIALQTRAAQAVQKLRKQRFDAENSKSRKGITVKPDWYFAKEAEAPITVLRKLYAVAEDFSLKYPAKRAFGMARLELNDEKQWLAHKEEELLAHRTTMMSLGEVDQAAADKTALLEVEVAEARAEVERLSDEMARAYAAKLAEEEEIVEKALAKGEDPPDFNEDRNRGLWDRLDRAEEEAEKKAGAFNRGGGVRASAFKRFPQQPMRDPEAERFRREALPPKGDTVSIDTSEIPNREDDRWWRCRPKVAAWIAEELPRRWWRAWRDANFTEEQQHEYMISNLFEPANNLDDECEKYVAYLRAADSSKEMAFLSIAVSVIEDYKKQEETNPAFNSLADQVNWYDLGIVDWEELSYEARIFYLGFRAPAPTKEELEAAAERRTQLGVATNGAGGPGGSEAGSSTDPLPGGSAVPTPGRSDPRVDPADVFAAGRAAQEQAAAYWREEQRRRELAQAQNAAGEPRQDVVAAAEALARSNAQFRANMRKWARDPTNPQDGSIGARIVELDAEMRGMVAGVRSGEGLSQQEQSRYNNLKNQRMQLLRAQARASPLFNAERVLTELGPQSNQRGADTIAVVVAKLKREIYCLDAVIDGNTDHYVGTDQYLSYNQAKKRLTPDPEDDVDWAVRGRRPPDQEVYGLEYLTDDEKQRALEREKYRRTSKAFVRSTALERIDANRKSLAERIAAVEAASPEARQQMAPLGTLQRQLADAEKLRDEVRAALVTQRRTLVETLRYYLNTLDLKQRGDSDRFIPQGVPTEEKAELERWLRVRIDFNRYAPLAALAVAPPAAPGGDAPASPAAADGWESPRYAPPSPDDGSESPRYAPPSPDDQHALDRMGF